MSGQLADGLVRALVELALVGLLVITLRRTPRLAVGMWIAVVCFVPVWAGIQVHIFLEPQVLVGVVVLVALFPLRRALPVPLTGADLVLFAFIVAALVPVVLGASTIAAVFTLLVKWGGALLLGRLVGHRLPLQWIYGAVTVAFTAVAVFALVEWATGWNPFLDVPGSAAMRAGWAVVQVRGGVPRAEGAFGHSIALGGSLAVAVPMALAAPFRPAVRAVAVLLMTAACAVTFSRIGLATAVLGVLLSLVFLRNGLPVRLRLMVAGGMAVVSAVVLPMLNGVFAVAGSEASNSAAYRMDLLGLLSQVQPLGISPSFHRTVTGDAFFGAYHSIDSALVLIGVTYGWIPLVILLCGALLAVGTMLRGQAAAPVIAVVAQLPAFATVAMITQYAAWAWFVAGLAIAAQVVERQRLAAQPRAAGDAASPDDSPARQSVAAEGRPPPHSQRRDLVRTTADLSRENQP